MVTPSPQPMVMTIHPAPSAFDHFNNTPPTTPTPNVIKTIVPRSSPINSVNITTSYILIDTINIIKTFFKEKKRDPHFRNIQKGCMLHENVDLLIHYILTILTYVLIYTKLKAMSTPNLCRKCDTC